MRELLETLGPVLAWVLAGLNVLEFSLIGHDKRAARRGKRRVRERTLLLLEALGGSLGVCFGMWAFHHKTLHPQFWYGLPLLLLLHLALAAAWILL